MAMAFRSLRLFMIAGSATLASTAHSAIITFTVDLAANASNIAVNKFDTSLGLLNSATIDFTSIADTNIPYGYTNGLPTGAPAGSIAVRITGNHSLSGLPNGSTVPLVFNRVINPFAVPFVPSGLSLVPLSASEQQSTSFTLPSDLASFEGLGSYNLATSGFNYYTVFGTNGSRAAVPASTTAKRIVVTYEYLAAAPVPEPATWALLITGFGMIGGAFRRTSFRQRMAL